MSKVSNNNQNYKISVDQSTIDWDKGIIACECHIILAHSPEYDTTVTFQEFKDYKTFNGKVKVDDGEDYQMVTFDQWFDDLTNNTEELNDELSDYINKRDRRKSFIYDKDLPNIPATIMHMLNPKNAA